jgi:hypothetical protein
VDLLVLRDRQAADDIWSDEETLRIMRPDEPRVFSTYVRNFTLVAEEAVLRDGEPTDCVVAAFLGLREGTDPAIWRAPWPRRTPPSGWPTRPSALR